jgi:hypothetical protein
MREVGAPGTAEFLPGALANNDQAALRHVRHPAIVRIKTNTWASTLSV